MQGRVRDTAGRPWPDVLVSDGRDVTVSAADGTFAIDPQGPYVFVSTPADAVCARWFVPATQSRPTFTLERAEPVLPYTFAHLTDLHLSSGPEAGALYPDQVELGTADGLRALLRTIRAEHPDVRAAFVTGDLTDAGTDAEFAALRSATADPPLPLRLMPGNHDHMNGSITQEVSPTGYALHSAHPQAYERHVGPRWYSFDIPGLHVVTVDWHTFELGIDADLQLAWIRRDLAHLPARTPWLLLSHDQPWTTMLGELPSPPLATLSGHRHVSRVVEVDGVLHVSTPTSLFAALDYTRPSIRLVRWDGRELQFSNAGARPTRRGVPHRPGAKPLLWSRELRAAPHHPPVVHGDAVLVGVGDETRPRGGVVRLDPATGELRWRHETGAAVKGPPAAAGDVVAAVDASGHTHVLDAGTGEPVWSRPSTDPLRTFTFVPPCIHDGTVFVGDIMCLQALDATTGELRWRRDDLGLYQSFVPQSANVVAEGLLVTGSWPWPRLVALDPADGRTVWPHEAAAEAEVGFGRADTPLATPFHDPADRALYLNGLGSTARIDLDGGTTVWRSARSIPWNVSRPVTTPRGVVVTDAAGAVTLLDRDTGGTVWETHLPGAGPFPLSSYRVSPQNVFAGALPHGGQLLVPGVDGSVFALDAASGELLRTTDLGMYLAAPLTSVGGGVLMGVALSGVVFALLDSEVMG